MKFMLNVKLVKEKRMKKWMERADYEATLKVVQKPNNQLLDDQEVEENSLPSEIESLIKIDQYMNRADEIIQAYIKLKKSNLEKRAILEKLQNNII